MRPSTVLGNSLAAPATQHQATGKALQKLVTVAAFFTASPIGHVELVPLHDQARLRRRIGSFGQKQGCHLRPRKSETEARDIA